MATETTLRISGMDCGHCASRLGEALERVEGVITADVDARGTAAVRYDGSRIGEEQLGEWVRATGLDVG